MVSESRFFRLKMSGEPSPGWPHKFSNVWAGLSSLCSWAFPPAGFSFAAVLACCLEDQTGHPVAQGSLDPTFHRDDLERVAMRPVQATDLPVSVEGRDVLLVDDVIFTGRTIRAALEAIQAWGRPRRVLLLVMVDRGHRELPIQPDFYGRAVPTGARKRLSCV